MYNQRVERSAGYAGIAWVVVMLLAAVLPGVPPAANAPFPELVAYLDLHRGMWLLSAWLSFPGAAFFLWFVVQLRAFLALAPQTDDGLPAYMLAAGVTTVGIDFVLSTLAVATVFHHSPFNDALAVQNFFDALNAAGTLIFAPMSILVLAASHSGRRHASLPAALTYWGYLTALLTAIATLSLFFARGFFALGGVAAFAIGFIPVAVWTIWTSLVLIRTPRGTDQPS